MAFHLLLVFLAMAFELHSAFAACATLVCNSDVQPSDNCTTSPVCLTDSCCQGRGGCQSCCSAGSVDYDCCPNGYGTCESSTVDFMFVCNGGGAEYWGSQNIARDYQYWGSQNFSQCAASCNANCSGFEIGGCSADSWCFGDCWTLRHNYTLEQIQSSTCDPDANGSKKFYFKAPFSGIYLIQNVKSRLFMDLVDETTDENTLLQQSDNPKRLSTRWQINTFPAGGYVIESFYSGRKMKVQTNQLGNGANIWVRGSTGGSAKWYIGATSTMVGNGAFVITNHNSGKFLSVENNDTANGALLCQVDTVSASSLWYLIRSTPSVSSHVVSVVNVHSDKVLNVASGSNYLQQTSDIAALSSQWLVSSLVTDSAYIFTNVDSGKVMTFDYNMDVKQGLEEDGCAQWKISGTRTCGTNTCGVYFLAVADGQKASPIEKAIRVENNGTDDEANISVVEYVDAHAEFTNSSVWYLISITDTLYKDWSISDGLGSCMDAQGNLYSACLKFDVARISNCEEECNRMDSCLAYELQNSDTECALRYDEANPMMCPDGFHTWSSRGGYGPVASVGGGWLAAACHSKLQYSPPATTVATTTTVGNSPTMVKKIAKKEKWQRGLIEFSLTMNITNVANFVEEPELENVLRDAMAELVGVNASWIQNIRIVQLRRLAVQSSWRELQTGFDMTTTDGTIKIEFDVVIPPDGGPGYITATLIMEQFDARSMTEASDIVNRIVKSGALGSTDYDVAITIKKGTIRKEIAIAPTPSSTEDEEELTVIIALFAAVGASVCLLLFLVFFLLRARRVQIRKRSELKHSELYESDEIDRCANFTELQLLFPPKTVTKDCKRQLLNFVSAMLDYSTPFVFVCFDVGQRDQDETHSGPGLYYVGAVIQALHKHGIPCYTSLPEAMESDACLQFLSGSDSSCKLLLLNDTPGVYQCRRCLEQIYTAEKANIEIIRLQFETGLPVEDYQWPNLRYDDLKALQMRELVREKLPARLIQPEAPELIQSVPGCLETFAIDLSRKYKSLESFAQDEKEGFRFGNSWLQGFKEAILMPARSSCSSNGAQGDFSASFTNGSQNPTGTMSASAPVKKKRIRAGSAPANTKATIMGRSSSDEGTSPKRKKEKAKLNFETSGSFTGDESGKMKATVSSKTSQGKKKSKRRSQDGTKSARTAG